MSLRYIIPLLPMNRENFFNDLQKTLDLSRTILRGIVPSTLTGLLLLMSNIGRLICRLVVGDHCCSNKVEWRENAKLVTFFSKKLTRVSKSPPNQEFLAQKKVSHVPFFSPPVAHGNGVLAPLPQNISAMAASRKKAAFKSKSDDILEVYKLKMLQKDGEREAERERYERDREERAAEKRMHRKEEERRFRHEVEIRKAEAEARRKEMKAEAESRREEAKSFREMMLFMMLGEKQDDNNN